MAHTGAGTVLGVALSAVAATLAAACGRTVDGVVSAPMTASLSDAGAQDARVAPVGGAARARPLPPEPSQPPRTACRREVSCRPEEDEAPALPFAPPFERCLPAAGKGRAGQLSVRETRSARADDPRACCYVDFRDCKPPTHGGWP